MKNDFSNLFIGDGDDLADAKPPKNRETPKKGRGAAKADPAHFIGCPLRWFNVVRPILRSRDELAIALFLYRQRIVQGSLTITIANGRLSSEVGISRYTKYRAIKRLENAGIITVRRDGSKAAVITFRRLHGARKEGQL